MACLSVASRKTPQAAGGQKYSNKLFLILPQKKLFFGASRKLLHKLASHAILQARSQNGLGGPFEGRK